MFRIGYKVLIYFEKFDNLIGPFTVIFIEGRMITVQTLDSNYKYLFKSFQLKLYFEEIISSIGTSPPEYKIVEVFESTTNTTLGHSHK